MLSQGFVIVARRLDAEDHRGQAVLNFDSLDICEQLLKAFKRVIKDQLLNQCLAASCPEKCVMLLFCCVNADNQILLRAANLFLQLKKLLSLISSTQFIGTSCLLNLVPL